MDYLARSLGLDIEALAIQLATADDDSNIKPITETIPQQQFVQEIPSLAETPSGPMRPDEVRKGVLVKKGAQQSIINPIFLRPCQYNSPIASHASASNVSIVRQEAQPCEKSPSPTHGPNFRKTDNFSKDNIHQAF